METNSIVYYGTKALQTPLQPSQKPTEAVELISKQSPMVLSSWRFREGVSLGIFVLRKTIEDLLFKS